MSFSIDKLNQETTFIGSKNGKNSEVIKMKERKNWKHPDIMENTGEFKDYLLKLTDIKYLKNLLDKNIIFNNLVKEKSLMLNFKQSFKNLLKEDLDVKSYNSWRKTLIDEYIDLFVNQIKEKEKYVIEIERNKYVSQMKRERNSFNFIIEHLFWFNNYKNKVNINEIHKDISRIEYIENVNIILNILLVLYYLFYCYDVEIDKTYMFESETINQMLKNLKIFTNNEVIESFYKDIIWLMRQFLLIQHCIDNEDVVNEENNKLEMEDSFE